MANDRDDVTPELRALANKIGREPVDWESPPEGSWDRIAADLTPTGHDIQVAPRHRAPRRDAPWRRVPVWASVAAAAVAIAAVISVWWIASDSSSDDATVVATSQLEPIESTGAGSAELVDDDGALRLRVDTTGLDAGDGFFEVWLINPDQDGLLSLGPLRVDGVYDLPRGIDPQVFRIVDVSKEPFDGDPTHSSESVLQGTLRF